MQCYRCCAVYITAIQGEEMVSLKCDEKDSAQALH